MFDIESVKRSFAANQAAFAEQLNTTAKEKFELEAHNWALNALQVNAPPPKSPYKAIANVSFENGFNASIVYTNDPVSTLDPVSLVNYPRSIMLGAPWPTHPERFTIIGGTQNTIGEIHEFDGVEYVIVGGFFGVQMWFEVHDPAGRHRPTPTMPTPAVTALPVEKTPRPGKKGANG